MTQQDTTAEPVAETNSQTAPQNGTSRRGFASMDPAKQKAIASSGGKAGHAMGKAHRFTSEEAKLAGAKGGKAKRRKREALAASVEAATTSGSDEAPVVDSGELAVENQEGVAPLKKELVGYVCKCGTEVTDASAACPFCGHKP